MIHKGCTSVKSFKFPFDASDVKLIFITFKEDDKTIIEKTFDDCVFTEGAVSVKISQEDSLKFSNDAIVKIQIRVKFTNDETTKSNILETYTDSILKGEVI